MELMARGWSFCAGRACMRVQRSACSLCPRARPLAVICWCQSTKCSGVRSRLVQTPDKGVLPPQITVVAEPLNSRRPDVLVISSRALKDLGTTHLGDHLV